MKKHRKEKLRQMTNDELTKRYNYLKSKLAPGIKESNQMKYIKFHMRKRQNA